VLHMAIAIRTLVLYIAILISCLAIALCSSRIVGLSRAWWIAVDDGGTSTLPIIDFAYADSATPRAWDVDVIRYNLKIIARLYAVVNSTTAFEPPTGASLVTLLATAKTSIGCVLKSDTGAEVWVAFRGVWTVSEMIGCIFHVHQLPYSSAPVGQTMRDDDRVQRPFEYMKDHPAHVDSADHLVHAGIFAEYEQFRDSLHKAICSFDPKPTSIMITGHSMGGALATLAYHDLSLSGFHCVLYTFGACRVLSPRLRSAIEALPSTGPIFRVENDNDVVPMFPLPVHPNVHEPKRPFLYDHVGQRVMFRATGGTLTRNHCVATYLAAFP
jgi:hypothetical protein